MVTSMSDFKEKLQGLSFPRKRGTSKKTQVQRESDGTVGGYQTEHWDDRVDATVQPKTLKMKLRMDRDG